jgi:hypothetical protein
MAGNQSEFLNTRLIFVNQRFFYSNFFSTLAPKPMTREQLHPLAQGQLIRVTF